MTVVDLLTPMFAMVVLTVCVLIVGLVARIRAVRSGQVKVSYFKTFDGSVSKPSDIIIQQKNHLENLFQVPVLFYVVCLAAMSLEIHADSLWALAWAYVMLRVIHTVVHLTYNKVLHRMLAFVLSNVILIVMWVRVLILASGTD